MTTETRTTLPEAQALHADCWRTLSEHTAVLIAYRCTSCGTHFLPAVMTCTRCGSQTFNRSELSQRGTLYTYSIVHGAGGVWPPVYTVGYVDFPEGVRVFGQVRETVPGTLAVGASVGIEPAALYERKDGTVVRCFRFHTGDGEAQ